MKKLAIAIFIALAYSASAADSYQIKLPNGVIIRAEVAKDKAKGLSGRESLCPDCGMIFIYEREGHYTFWMRDTLIPLAMIWLDAEGRVVHIVKDAPPCRAKENPYGECRMYSPSIPAKYVLETNPKAAVGVELGMKLKTVSERASPPPR
ncbi:MAG: DUF192 domain-containing protein [Deltaproteobacteria bacterium]